VERAHSWNFAIKSDEQVETFSPPDPIDDEAIRGLSDRAASNVSPFDQPARLVDVDMMVTAVPGNGIRSVTRTLDMRGVPIIHIGTSDRSTSGGTYSPICAA
jgi:hypothetical protein